MPTGWTLASFCGLHDAAALAAIGLLPGLFVFGVVGSALHCAPMCGPFVLAQVADRLAAVPAERLCEARRVTAGLLPLYHAGRLTTYSALGAAAAGLWGWWLPATLAPAVSAGLLASAAAVLAWQAWRSRRAGRRLPAAPRSQDRPAGGLAAINKRLAACTVRTGPLPNYGLGVLLGFLPCGMLYTALAAATATGNAFAGGLAMACFCLGTVPGLALVGTAGVAAGRARIGWVRTLRPFMLAANAGLLLLVAGLRLWAA